MPIEKTFMARQPILNLYNDTFGYELLFRSTDLNYADINDHSQASAKVIFETLSNFGYEKVLGSHKGFINLNNDMLMSDTLEILPARRFVLELLEIVEVNNSIVERCRELKSKGFTIALDDNIFSQAFIPLYDLVDIVKIDVLQMTEQNISLAAEMVSRWPVTLLAEKVETDKQWQLCRELGFQLFQGYYFARPTLLNQARVDTEKTTLIRLLDLVLSDAEVSEIEKTFRQNPGLTYKLLRLVNSVMFGRREKTATVRQAIVTVGMQNLKRWVLMALFANTDDNMNQSPLMEMAVTRGRLMENLVERQEGLKANRSYSELAFLTGLLSLLDVQLAMPMEELAEQLNLSEELSMALLHREGPLGMLLALCECMENGNSGGVVEILRKIRMDENEFLDTHLDVINWTNSLCSSKQ